MLDNIYFNVDNLGGDFGWQFLVERFWLDNKMGATNNIFYLKASSYPSIKLNKFYINIYKCFERDHVCLCIFDQFTFFRAKAREESKSKKQFPSIRSSKS